MTVSIAEAGSNEGVFIKEWTSSLGNMFMYKFSFLGPLDFGGNGISGINTLCFLDGSCSSTWTGLGGNGSSNSSFNATYDTHYKSDFDYSTLNEIPIAGTMVSVNGQTVSVVLPDCSAGQFLTNQSGIACSTPSGSSFDSTNVVRDNQTHNFTKYQNFTQGFDSKGRTNFTDPWVNGTRLMNLTAQFAGDVTGLFNALVVSITHDKISDFLTTNFPFQKTNIIYSNETLLNQTINAVTNPRFMNSSTANANFLNDTNSSYFVEITNANAQFYNATNPNGYVGAAFKTNLFFTNETLFNTSVRALAPNASTTTCSGTDKFSAYNNNTGVFTCTTDTGGAGGGDNNLDFFGWISNATSVFWNGTVWGGRSLVVNTTLILNNDTNSTGFFNSTKNITANQGWFNGLYYGNGTAPKQTVLCTGGQVATGYNSDGNPNCITPPGGATVKSGSLTLIQGNCSYVPFVSSFASLPDIALGAFSNGDYNDPSYKNVTTGGIAVCVVSTNGTVAQVSNTTVLNNMNFTDPAGNSTVNLGNGTGGWANATRICTAGATCVNSWARDRTGVTTALWTNTTTTGLNAFSVSNFNQTIYMNTSKIVGALINASMDFNFTFTNNSARNFTADIFMVNKTGNYVLIWNFTYTSATANSSQQLNRIMFLGGGNFTYDGTYTIILNSSCGTSLIANNFCRAQWDNVGIKVHNKPEFRVSWIATTAGNT